MSLKRTISLLALSLFIVVSAEGKRRSVRFPAVAAPAACHTFNLVRAGLVASYLSNAPGGDVTYTITYISDTPTQLKTTQKVVTPQATTEVETTVDGEVVGNLRGIKHIKVKGTTTVPVLGKTPLEVDIDFVPSLLSGPAAGWCTGAKWTVSPVTETIVARSAGGTFTNVVTTIATEGEVLAVGESITVPAGTFKTVKYRGAIVSGNDVQPAITWVSMEHNIVVRQDTVDSAGNVTSVTRLMELR